MEQNAGEQPRPERVIRELARMAFAPEEDPGVKTADRLKSLELLGKHMGMFTDGMKMVAEKPVIVDDVRGAREDGDGD